jgi:hypothetical protein
MSVIRSERIRLERNLEYLLCRKQLLDDEQQKLVSDGRYLEEYGKHLERIEWSNYANPLKQKYERDSQILRDQAEQLNAKLEKTSDEIEIVQHNIAYLEFSDSEKKLESILLPEYEPIKEPILPVIPENPSKPRIDPINKKKQPEPYPANAINIPRGMRYFIGQDEELKSWLVEYRIEWYQEKSFIPSMRIEWLLHFQIWLMTWLLVFIELVINRLLMTTIYRFQPLHKPRLPK